MEMMINELTEVLKICEQYDKQTTIFCDNGVLFIDGYKTVRSMTEFEKETIIKHGFKFDERNGIYFVCQNRILGVNDDI